MEYRCTKCGNLLEEGTSPCPSCGQTFNWPEKKELFNSENVVNALESPVILSTGEKIVYDDMMFCTHCGAKIYSEAVICPNCGCNTNSAALEKILQPEDRVITQLRNYAYIAIIGGVLLPLLGWIFGGIGLAKAQNLSLTNDSFEVKEYKVYSIIALIIATVITIGLVIAGAEVW